MSRSTVGKFLRPQRGLTLVELMVALVMGLVLLGGVVTVFVANKETYRVQDALARVQENGRFALSLLTRELRTSGLMGCSTLKPLSKPRNTVRDGSLFPAGSRFADYERPADGFEAISTTAWSPPLDPQFASLATQPTAGNDVLLVRVVDGNEERVTLNAATTAPLVLQSNSRLQVGDVAIVSDCEGAAVFQVTGVSGSTVTHNVDLGKQFPSAATVAEVQEIRNTAYYVAPSNVSAEPALWRWDGINAAQEMAEGIERLQVRFGIDINGDQAVDQYDTAAEVENGNNWGNVISVRVSLVLRSPDQNVTSGGQGYVLDGTNVPVASTDTRLRQVFTTTIAVRNRQS
jgi:type IV pilus assembly protein PilW